MFRSGNWIYVSGGPGILIPIFAAVMAVVLALLSLFVGDILFGV